MNHKRARKIRASSTAGLKALIGAGLLIGSLLSSALLADQNHPKLNALFSDLKNTEDQGSADEIASEIWMLWREVDNAEAAEALARGVQAMSSRQYRTAYEYFSEVIDQEPDFAEGWNKRATLLYLVESYDDSIRDIKETLRLEPRHFGALSGLGLIFLRQHQFGAAKKAFQSALEINPHLPQIRQALEALETRQPTQDEKNAI